MADGESTNGYQADAESRFVALLKFDLVDSTRISIALSPSDELELQREYVRVVEQAVHLDLVTIDWEGDGGLIVFGYPESRVDAAEAAVRTGLKLLVAVTQIDVLPHVHLQVRIGIASGRVTVDRTRRAFSRVKPISRATRLMDAAEPGQLLIAEDTRRLVKSFFDYDDLGVLELQGSGRTRVWRVRGETAVISRFEARHPDDPGEIVGRGDLLQLLFDAWDAAARDGRGAAFSLVGDSGMGKSRLAHAALERAARDHAVVLEIDCTPSTGNSPLLPIGVLLRRTAGVRPGDSEEEETRAAMSLLTRVLGESDALTSLTYLGPLFGLETKPIPREKTREQVHTATISAIVALVQALGRQGPLAILCEDLHWADDTTAQVVRALGEAVADLPALLLVTTWPKPVTRVDLHSVTRAFTVIVVDPLPQPTATAFVRSVAGDALPQNRIDDIVSRCGGVPLLLEEITRSTLEAADGPAAERMSVHADSAVPPELQLVVESRLSQWSQLRDIVEAASVIGREFPISALEGLVPDRASRIPEALSVFADQGLFASPGAQTDRASFRHALIRDAVYETVVGRNYRRRLHSRVADVLSGSLRGTPDASPEVIAEHLRIADRLQEAIALRLSAAEDTFSHGAYVEAMGHCQAVRDLLTESGGEEGNPADAFRLYLLLGMVGTGIHGYSADSAEAAYGRAYAMFGDRMDAASRYPVIRGLATAALVRGDLATANRYATEGLALAEESGRPDFRIDATSVLVYVTLYFGGLDDCRSLIEHCLTLYEQEHGERLRYPVPQDAKTAALALLPTAAWLLGDATGAEDAIQKGMAHVEALGRDFDTALLHAWTAGTRYTQRRYADALAHAARAHALGHEHRFEEWEGIGGLMALLSQTALAASPELVQQAVLTAQVFKARGVGLNGSYFLWGIARGYITAGDPTAAAAVLSVALQVAAASQETRMNAEIWMLQAEIEPDRSRAMLLLLDAYHLAVRQGSVANALRAAANFALDAGDAAGVAWAHRTLASLDGRAPGPAQPDWMAHALSQGRSLLPTLGGQPGA